MVCGMNYAEGVLAPGVSFISGTIPEIGLFRLWAF